MGGPGNLVRALGRTARALARLFEFEEFEQEFEEDFENLFGHAPTLRVAADLIAQRAVRRARAPRAPWTNFKAQAKQPQMEKRQATATNGKAKVHQEQMEKWQTNMDPQS